MEGWKLLAPPTVCCPVSAPDASIWNFCPGWQNNLLGCEGVCAGQWLEFVSKLLLQVDWGFMGREQVSWGGDTAEAEKLLFCQTRLTAAVPPAYASIKWSCPPCICLHQLKSKCTDFLFCCHALPNISIVKMLQCIELLLLFYKVFMSSTADLSSPTDEIFAANWSKFLSIFINGKWLDASPALSIAWCTLAPISVIWDNDQKHSAKSTKERLPDEPPT